MKKRVVSALFVLSCLLCLWLAGCSTTPIAGGTETQNPEIVACVKKFAEAAFDAVNTNGEWRPTHYLEDSIRAASLQKLAKRAAVPPAVSSKTEFLSTQSDTAFIDGAVASIHDTAIIRDTAILFDTLPVNKTLFITDTIADTLRSATMNRTCITLRVVLDSIIVKDTVIVADTIIRQYKRIILSVQRYGEGNDGIVQADTIWINEGIISLKDAKPFSGANERLDGVKPVWQVFDVIYRPEFSSVSYRVVSPPTKDTMILASGPNPFHILNNQLFLSLKKFDNSILTETIGFDMMDSLLSIKRFNPSSFDTVESLAIDYSIDIGVDRFSGVDDRLLAIERNYSYRLGTIHHLEMAIAPDRANSLSNTNKISNGKVSMILVLSDTVIGYFSGVVDTAEGLFGVYEQGGKKYQIHCDPSFTAQVIEIKP